MFRAAALCLLAAACASAPPAVTRWSAAPVSSAQYESHPAFDPLTHDLYFVRSAPDFSGWRIFVAHCGAHRRYQAPEPAAFAGADGFEADPFFTADGRTLYFISSRAEGGVRQTELDIWRVTRGAGNQWSQPQRLPQPINSDAQEWFPRLAADGWLYFGSSREGGLGRTDIYRGRPDQVGGWIVENLGPNINTPGDEYEADISPDGRRMLIMADGDLYQSRFEDGRWHRREKLGDDINTPAMEVGALFAPDGRSFLFARDSGDPALSGEIYRQRGMVSWPPRCR